MIEWIALGVAVFTFISWMVTTYLTFIRNRPQLVISVPRYVEKNDEWDIYVYNEGNRATRMLEQKTFLIFKKEGKKITIEGRFRPEDRKEYFTANPGAFHHFYTIYGRVSRDGLTEGLKAKIYLELKYNNGGKTKIYKKKIKLDQDDFDNYIKKN